MSEHGENIDDIPDDPTPDMGGEGVLDPSFDFITQPEEPSNYVSVTQPSAGTPGSDWQAALKKGLELAGITASAGSVIAKAINGDKTAKDQLSQVTRTMNPEQRQAMDAAMLNFQNTQNFIYGPGGQAALIGGQQNLNVPGAPTQTAGTAGAYGAAGDVGKFAGSFLGSKEFGNLATTDPDAFIKRLYKGFVDREPSAEEVGAWKAQLQAGQTPEQVAQGFINSDEYKAKAEGMSPEDRLQDLYQGVLGRDASEAELLGWQGQQGWGAAAQEGEHIPFSTQATGTQAEMLGNVASQQEAALTGATPLINQMASGQLAITPELQKQVDDMFSSAVGTTMEGLIEQARVRGFAGGAELLGQGHSSRLTEQALSDLAGRKAATLADLSMKLPQQGINLLGMAGGQQQGTANAIGNMGSNAINQGTALSGVATSGLGALTGGLTAPGQSTDRTTGTTTTGGSGAAGVAEGVIGGATNLVSQIYPDKEKKP